MSNLFSSGGAGNVGFSGETQQSLKFNDDESQYLSWTPAAAGNRKTWTWSGWVKRGNLGSTQNFIAAATGTSDPTHTTFRFDGSTSKILFAGWGGVYFSSDATFRDVSAWYHIVAVLDTTNATASDRIKVYVNGERLTGSNPVSIGSSVDLAINNTQEHSIGRSNYNAGSSYFDGYLSDIHFIDGQALDASSFGETVDGYWKAKDYAGTYGTNGFHLTFQDDVVSEGFNTVTYRGTGATQSISGLGFAPDLVWLKSRNAARSHGLFDAVRGRAKGFAVETANSEYSSSTGRDLVSFDADGFTVGNPENFGSTNTSGDSIVAWAWDAGSGSAASNTDGSITSTVKANPDYGFSIVSWAGNSVDNATFGHGLTVKPSLVICKARDKVEDWQVWNDDGLFTRLRLNSSGGDEGNFGVSISDSIVTLPVWNGAWNQSGYNYIAYCFNSVAGYSSIGSYSGTGSTVSVNTGFKAAWLLIKRTDTSGFSWVMLDNTRNPSGELDDFLLAENSIAETNNGTVKVLPTATGFDVTGTATSINASGGTYIYMAFADTREAAFWKDVSGQGNHWTPNNLDYRDSLIDSPTNNFATLNPLNAYRSGNVYSEGNLRAVPTSPYNLAYATMAQSTGKWYWEIYVEHRVSTNNNTAIGLEEMPASSSYLTKAYWDFGSTRNDGSIVASDGTYPSFATGDVISVAVDFDNGKLWFAHNGSWINSGDPSAGTNNPLSTTVGSTYSPAFFLYYTATIPKFIANFGQDSTFSGNRPAGGNQDDNGVGDFAYAPPSGYLALCTANLPTPTIVDGSEHFNTVLWSGDSVDNRDITGIGFDADLTWFKARSNANWHALADTVRGNSNPNILFSNSTNAESDWTSIFKGHITDGFTVGTDSAINQSGQTYAAWNWKAGGTAVSNTDGSITSQVSAGEYMSICTWTGNGTSGATIGHGLNKVPSMLIVKRTNAANGWPVYHEALGTGSEVYLNYTQGATSSNFWITSPTSSVFSVSNSDYVNTSSDTYVGYAFANLDGACKVGSYTGNGSTDGPFIYTGFRPAFTLVKRTDSTDDWYLRDAQRDIDNPTTQFLEANTSNAEGVGIDIDYLSNGVKVRGTGVNASGGTYIFLAFAENPFKYANAR